MKLLPSALTLLLAACLLWQTQAADTKPGSASDRLVVLTFDDSVASHATFVAPLLKKHGFGATFFITEGFEFLVDKKH
ncbi:MAG TPA: polysaccharide deacetylase family protein, partial [Prosthecobacter sp.]